MRAIVINLLLLFCAVTAHAYSADSLYSLALNWSNDRSESVPLSSFEGRDVIVVMVYTSCRSVCPLIVSKLKSIERAAAEQRRKTEFVLISLDPKNDTPQVLAAFRKRENLPHESWHLLVGTEQDTRKFSNLIGFSYQKNTGSGEIMHSNKITLLNAQGEISHVLEGLNEDISPLMERLK